MIPGSERRKRPIASISGYRFAMAMLNKLFIRAVRSPKSICNRVYNSMLVPFWLRLIGVKIGAGCRFTGLPIVSIARGAGISIGDHVLINSSETSNSVGLPHRTILDARTPGSIIDIGDYSGISGASIVAQTSVTIGRHVQIGGGAGIWDTDFHPIDPDMRLEHPTRGARSAPIRIEDEVFIGARAVILKGVTVGYRAVIGAAAVVSKDVKPAEIVAGNPAVVVSHIDEK